MLNNNIILFQHISPQPSYLYKRIPIRSLLWQTNKISNTFKPITMKRINLLLICFLLPVALFSQTLTTISPSGANTNQTLDVIITGDNTNFESSTTTVQFGIYTIDNIAVNVVNSVTVLSPTSVKANITIPSNIVTGNYAVYVKVSNMSIQGAFHVNGLPTPPYIRIISDLSEIVAGKTVDITIRGHKTHFMDPNGTNATKVFFKPYNLNSPLVAVMNSMTIIDDSTMVVNITAPGKATANRVYISNNTDGELNAVFKVYTNCHAYFTTSYNTTSKVFTLMLDSLTTLATNLTWDFGDGTFSSALTPTHTFAKDTIYSVRLRVNNINGDSCWYGRPIGIDENGDPVLKIKGFTIQVVPYKPVNTGIDTQQEKTAPLAVYPNPATDFITIETQKISATNKSVILIYSMDGKLMLQETLVQVKKVLDISSLKKGIYILQVTGADRTEHIKFIKD